MQHCAPPRNRATRTPHTQKHTGVDGVDSSLLFFFTYTKYRTIFAFIPQSKARMRGVLPAPYTLKERKERKGVLVHAVEEAVDGCRRL